jgi:hypothetical protein
MKSDAVRIYVIAMLALQAISVACLWILNVLSAETSSVFSVLLAANLIAFAMVLQVYRNPATVEPSPVAKEPAPVPPPVSAPAPSGTPATPSAPVAPAPPSAAPAAPQSQAPQAHEPPRSETYVPLSPSSAALPRMVHVVLPIAATVVVLALAIVTFFPPNKSSIPPGTTGLFVPIYLLVVLALVFGGMYLFKRLLDAEEVPSAH